MSRYQISFIPKHQLYMLETELVQESHIAC